MPNFNLAEDQFIATPRQEERMTKEQIREKILRKLDQALFHLFPNGETSRCQFLIGDIHGHEGDSLKVELEGSKAGQWYDFATGEGGDIFDLWGAVHSWDTRSRFPNIMSDMQKWLGVSPRVFENPHPKKQKKLDDLGAPTGKWDYQDAQGQLIACVYRYDPPGGKKQFRPFDVKAQKHTAPDPRPLYNQPGILQSDSVILVEGEKCAEGLISLGMCATTAMGGANAPIDKTDWSPLKGKHVLVWPDNDRPGRDYRDAVIAHLQTLNLLSLSVIQLPDDLPEKWDAADAVAEKRNIDIFLKNNAKMVSLETMLAPDTILQTETAEVLCDIPTFLFRDWRADQSPIPHDLIFPRVLTPGGLLVFGGAPKVGKTDFLLNWLAHMAAGLSFLGMQAQHPLRIFYLQTEVPYHYLRERIHQLNIDPNFLPLVDENLAITDSIMMTLNEEGVQRVIQAIQKMFVPDIIVIDPLRNVFDGKSENDNMEMMAFLQDRVEALRYQVNRSAGMILVHHTRKAGKQELADDPFQALSGAGCLRSFYTTGMILHACNDEQSLRRLVFELRCGKPIPMKHVDKIGSQWCEMDVKHARTVRQDFGKKCDGERQRLKDVILQRIFNEAKEGKLYSPSQFCNVFDSKDGLGAESSISRRLDVLASQGFIRFNKDQPNIKGKSGVMCVEGMLVPSEETDPETGEAVTSFIPFLPTHYKYQTGGVLLPVEDPHVWIYKENQQS